MLIARGFHSNGWSPQFSADSKPAVTRSPESQRVRDALEGWLLGTRVKDLVPHQIRYQALRVAMLELLKRIAAELPPNAGAEEVAKRISAELQGPETVKLFPALFMKFEFEDELAARPMPAAEAVTASASLSPACQRLRSALEACRLDRAHYGKYRELHEACYALLAQVFGTLPSSRGAKEIALALSAELEGLDQFSLATLAIILRENQFSTSLVETEIDDPVLEEFGFANGPPHMKRTTKFSPEDFLALLDKLSGGAAHDPLMSLAARGFSTYRLHAAISVPDHPDEF